MAGAINLYSFYCFNVLLKIINFKQGIK